GIYGGYACLYAKELTREGIWEALKARRCYGTNGRRILVDFHVNGQPMGSEMEVAHPPEMGVVVCATAPVEKVDVFRGTEIIYTYPENIAREETRIRISWSGQRILARNRLARWDGGVMLKGGRIVDAEGLLLTLYLRGLRL
ncbi:MAG: DUF3604 domain-containing protein, partial [Candidatus Latescibacterota bacterium]